ncbi:MAG: sensor histidine kinase [Saprospiraceae bacterium]
MWIQTIRRKYFSNAEIYVPYIYCTLMPLFTLYSFKIPVKSVFEALQYIFITGAIQFILWHLIRMILSLESINQLARWAIALICAPVLYLVYRFIDDNLLHVSFWYRDTKLWLPTMRLSMNGPIFIALIESIRAFRSRAKIITDNISLQNENVKAQFNQLLQQINPHFLFNSLTTLQAMVRSKDSRTVEFIEKLEDVYRQTLKLETGEVTLSEELAFFNSYMYLMTLRQEKSIFWEADISEKSLTLKLPVFSLQLLAENCIKHNIVSKAKPLFIKLFQKDPNSVSISNNYQPKEYKSESFGIGITNLKKRYELAGIENGVLIEQDEKTYTTTLKLI